GVAEWAPSEAVIVCDPALSSVAENVPWPLVKVESDGKTTPADWSVLLKCSVPAPIGSGLPQGSFAVTVKGNATPAVGVAAVATARLLAASLSGTESAVTMQRRAAAAGVTG